MSWYKKHEELLKRAGQAIHERTFYTPYPEHHSAWGEAGITEGLKTYESLLNGRFGLHGSEDAAAWTGQEESPYTQEELGVLYPSFEVNTLVQNAQAAAKSWKAVPVTERAGLLAEVLERIQSRFFEMAYATMHTSGQSFMMAFQASGPHASDRALEATALGLMELQRFPAQVKWEKPMGKSTIELEKWFVPVPKGVAVVIGCSTFPVWNTVPGLFASLVTGNPVIVKPHPQAVLPIALVVAELQKAFAEMGLPATTVQLAVDQLGAPKAKLLAEDPAVKIIDYTGGSTFGDFLETLPGKTTFTEKSGVNPVIIDSVENLDAVLQNLAFSITLFSGQMCTAPQNFFIPETGVREGERLVPYAEVVQRFRQAISDLANHPKIGAGTLAALQNEGTQTRVKRMEAEAESVVLASKPVQQPSFENARSRTPLLLETSADKSDFQEECFGPIAFVVKTKSTQQSIALARSTTEEFGAITCAVYTTDSTTEALIREEMEAAFTPVSFNLTGFIWVNQAAAFSDFHVTGGNPAGNASFANPEYLNKRFVWVGHRKKY